MGVQERRGKWSRVMSARANADPRAGAPGSRAADGPLVAAVRRIARPSVGFTLVLLIFLLFSLGLEFDQDAFFGTARALLLSGGTRIAINMAVGSGLGLVVGSVSGSHSSPVVWATTVAPA